MSARNKSNMSNEVNEVRFQMINVHFTQDVAVSFRQKQLVIGTFIYVYIQLSYNLSACVKHSITVAFLLAK